MQISCQQTLVAVRVIVSQLPQEISRFLENVSVQQRCEVITLDDELESSLGERRIRKFFKLRVCCVEKVAHLRQVYVALFNNVLHLRNLLVGSLSCLLF